MRVRYIGNMVKLRHTTYKVSIPAMRVRYIVPERIPQGSLLVVSIPAMRVRYILKSLKMCF